MVTCPIDCVKAACPDPDFLEKHSSFVLTVITLGSGFVSVEAGLDTAEAARPAFSKRLLHRGFSTTKPMVKAAKKRQAGPKTPARKTASKSPTKTKKR